MPKRILIFYLLGIFLLNVSFVIAYHGGGGIGGAAITPLRAVIILIGVIVIFISIIWFFRKASINVGKKRK